MSAVKPVAATLNSSCELTESNTIKHNTHNANPINFYEREMKFLKRL
jgi:hypothetical protein